MKTKSAVLFILILIAFLAAGCERLTASLDGVDKEETAEAAPAAVSENVTLETENKETQTKETTTKESNTGVLTGGVAAEIGGLSEPQSTTYTVKMTADGFSPDKLNINAGDTVIWKNIRYGTINKAMIIGVRECSKVRSGFLKSGESYKWTFDEPMTCTIADGIMTTKESKIYVK